MNILISNTTPPTKSQVLNASTLLWMDQDCHFRNRKFALKFKGIVNRRMA